MAKLVFLLISILLLIVTSKSKDTPKHQSKPYKCIKGTMTMFFGAQIPKGYQLCDGSNGTPDMRNKFVIAAGSQYPFGTTGGSESVQLNIDQMPEHSHNMSNMSVLSDGQHTHSTVPVIEAAGSHFHDAGYIYTKSAADHDHGGVVSFSGVHDHSIDSVTDSGGYHHHYIEAFGEVNSTTDPDAIISDLKFERVDEDQPREIFTSSDSEHIHRFDATSSVAGNHTHGIYPDGAHSHEVDGKTGVAGNHVHDADVHVASSGDHTHELDGDMSTVGQGEPIDIKPPFISVYFICCV